MEYVLITAAKNESANILRTLESVTAQTRPPARWVIVDDGSTDATPEIVEKFAEEYDWIELIRQPRRDDRSFAGKAHAVNAGLAACSRLEFGVVGNLDADVSFGPEYMAFLVAKFEEDPNLGVAGTPFTEEGGYDSTRDSFEGRNYVPGPCQLFRLECWRQIGGYVANKAGGVDWIACTASRMNGWKVCAFPEKSFHHHRSMGTAQRGKNASMFSYGEKDYYLGGSFVWEVFRCFYRMSKRPLITGGISLMAGYMWAAIRRMPKVAPPEMIKFHQKEQRIKLKRILSAVVRGQRLDNFSLGASVDELVHEKR